MKIGEVKIDVVENHMLGTELHFVQTTGGLRRSIILRWNSFFEDAPGWQTDHTFSLHDDVFRIFFTPILNTMRKINKTRLKLDMDKYIRGYGGESLVIRHKGMLLKVELEIVQVLRFFVSLTKLWSGIEITVNQFF